MMNMLDDLFGDVLQELEDVENDAWVEVPEGYVMGTELTDEKIDEILEVQFDE